MTDITKFYLRDKGSKFIKFYLASEDNKLKFTRHSYLKISYLALFAPCAASDHQGLLVEN